MHLASQHARYFKCRVGDALAEARKSWADHVASFETNGRPPHFLKMILLCRSLPWWDTQKRYNKISGAAVCLHKPRLGKPLKWETSLEKDFILRGCARERQSDI